MAFRIPSARSTGLTAVAKHAQISFGRSPGQAQDDLETVREPLPAYHSMIC